MRVEEVPRRIQACLVNLLRRPGSCQQGMEYLDIELNSNSLS